MSRTYAGSGSPSGTCSSGSRAVPVVSTRSGPGRFSTTRRSIAPDPDSDTVSTVPSGGSWSASGPVGSLQIRLICWALALSCLPVRSRNGTPCQRGVSIHSRAATNVSVCESGATPSVSR